MKTHMRLDNGAILCDRTIAASEVQTCDCINCRATMRQIVTLLKDAAAGKDVQARAQEFVARWTEQLS